MSIELRTTGPVAPRDRVGSHPPPDLPPHGGGAPTDAPDVRPGLGWRRAWLVAAPPAAVAVGLLSLRQSSLDRMGDYGLIQAVNAGYLVGLALLTTCFVAYLRWANRAPWLGALYLAAWVALLDVAPFVLEGEPRFPVTYVHAGFAEAIMRTGETLPLLDARFSWPGFFALFGYLSEAAGFDDTMPLAVWFPFVIKALWLAAMWVVLRRLVRDTAVCWLALWIFQLVEWSGQSYYSPQAMGFFTYLVCIAVLVVAMHPKTRPGPGGTAALAVVVVSFAALVVSHQLTPFMAISAAGLLGVLGLARARWLWLFFSVAFVVWFMWGTTDYWVGHIHGLLNETGKVGGNLDDNVGARLQGNPAHQRIVYARMGMSALVAGLAVLGFLVARRRRVLDPRAVVLAVAPAGSMILQSYGGEGLIRVFLFMLPILAGGAALFLLSPRRAPLLASVALGALLVALIPVSLLGKYGSESFESVSRSERRAAEWVHDRVQPGELVVSIAPAGYLREWGVGEVDFAPALDRFRTGDLRNLRALVQEHGGRGFLVLSKSQYAYGNMVSGLPKGWQHRLLAQLRTAPDFVLVHREGSTRVYVVDGTSRATN